jgi:hypothetical protein
MTTYRLDKVTKLPAGQDYKVPCGMNTILWMGEHSMNPFQLARNYPVPIDCVTIFSKWDDNLRDYKVQFILSNQSVKQL